MQVSAVSIIIKRKAEKEDVNSWDLCNHLCKNLPVKLKGYETLIEQWFTDPGTYKKRGAFTLMASAAIHEKNIAGDTLDEYLRLIKKTPEMSGRM